MNEKIWKILDELRGQGKIINIETLAKIITERKITFSKDDKEKISTMEIIISEANNIIDTRIAQMKKDSRL